MSGPKVVSIVTLEEVTATCKGHLARLDQAIRQWQKGLENLGEKDESYYQAIVEKRHKFDQMLKEQRFLEIQKLVPIEIDSLSDDIKQRKQLKTTFAAQLVLEEKQAKENIKTIVASLKNKQITISDTLNKDLEQAIKGKYQGNINQLLTQAFNLLVPEQKKQLSDRQQALLDRMDIDNTKKTFTDWLEQQNIKLQNDPYMQRIENYLAELALEQKDIYEIYAERLKFIEQEQQANRKKLLLDSFVLDLAKSLNEAKERSRLQAQIELLIAELKQQTTESLNIDLTMLDSADIQALKVLLEQCEQKLSEITQAAVATYRQQAILQGLSGLGYEVRQGMQTQWAKDGRLVLRNPATPGYGIELAGKAEIARMQVRSVKFTGDNNKQRDKDIETLWCGDFGKLQQWLNKQGSDLIIEKALPIGATALKHVEVNETESIEVSTVQETSFYRKGPA